MFQLFAMEFKYQDGQNQRTPSQMAHPLSIAAYISECPLQGSGLSPSGFLDNVPASNVFPMLVSVNAEEAFRRELVNEQIRWELEKEEIRREIIAGEMALAQRRELEEEVRNEMASERVMGMSAQRQEARPNARHYDAKCKAMTPFELDGNEHCSFSLHKKTNLGWSCELCQITTTSEKGLNDHLQGKKHKAKEASLETRKIGLDTRHDAVDISTMEELQKEVSRG